MGKLLFITGIILIAAGLLWMLGERIGIGSLPGDFVIKRENARIYIPLTSSLLIGLLVSLIIWLVRPNG